MKRTNAYYKNRINTPEKLEHEFNALRAFLVSRYQANPAVLIRNDNQTIILPMQYNEFTALALNAVEKKAALTAYYKHIDHTAWRYLARPNPWIAPNAVYVMRALNGTAHSLYDAYIPLITLLYIAASDKDMLDDHKGYTLTGRIDNFMQELALLCRAHNWDRSNEQGAQYDDHEGDKPSCYSGVKKRLLQSVLGHPLLTSLTPAGAEEELQAFVRAHFNTQWQTLTVAEQSTLSQHYSVYIDQLDATILPTLIQELLHFNISAVQKNNFLSSMRQKWGCLWTYAYNEWVLSKLAIAEDITTLAACHAETVGGIGGFVGLISNAREDLSAEHQFNLTHLTADDADHTEAVSGAGDYVGLIAKTRKDIIAEYKVNFTNLTTEILNYIDVNNTKHNLLHKELTNTSNNFFNNPITEASYKMFQQESTVITNQLRKYARHHQDGLGIILLKWSAALLSLGLVLLGSCIKSSIQTKQWKCRFFETNQATEMHFDNVDQDILRAGTL